MERMRDMAHVFLIKTGFKSGSYSHKGPSEIVRMDSDNVNESLQKICKTKTAYCIKTPCIIHTFFKNSTSSTKGHILKHKYSTVETLGENPYAETIFLEHDIE